jgi:hypothetical protein
LKGPTALLEEEGRGKKEGVEGDFGGNQRVSLRIAGDLDSERRRPGRLRPISAERMGNDGDARSQARGGGGGRPLSGKTTRTSRSKKDKLQKAMHDMELERGEENGSWLTEELLMLFEDEDGEFLNFTPSVRSRVTLASKKVRQSGMPARLVMHLPARPPPPRPRGEGEMEEPAFCSASTACWSSKSPSRPLGCAQCLGPRRREGGRKLLLGGGGDEEEEEEEEEQEEDQKEIDG